MPKESLILAAVKGAIAFSLAGAMATGAAACSVLEAVGRIDTIERAQDSDVQIKRVSGEQINALLYHYLCPGDRVLRSGSDTFVGVRWDGQSSLEYIEASNYEVKASNGGGIVAVARDWMERLGLLSRSDRSGLAIQTRTRSGDGGEGEEGQAPAIEIAPFRQGFTETQMIAANQNTIAVVWSGTALGLRLSEEGGRLISWAQVWGRSWTILQTPPDISSFVLEFTAADRSTQTISISRIREVPEGPTVGDTDPETAELVHALWLLREAGTEWRLEGLTRLQGLSSKSLAADHAWNLTLYPEER
ncbi:MAG: hypothetical protein AAGA34_07730 [Pseudomonadota bacterium]